MPMGANQQNGMLQITIPCFDADPAKVYEQRLLDSCVKLALDELPPRERTLIQQHLGPGTLKGKGMTFQEFAIRLNFNGHSAASENRSVSCCLSLQPA